MSENQTPNIEDNQNQNIESNIENNFEMDQLETSKPEQTQTNPQPQPNPEPLQQNQGNVSQFSPQIQPVSVKPTTNLFLFLAKHWIFGIIIILILVLTIGVLGVEAFAPKEYKVSNLWNKSSSSSSNSSASNSSSASSGVDSSVSSPIGLLPNPLVADENNDVAVLEKYNLAIKFSNKNVFTNIIHTYPFGGGSLPGITLQYNSPNNKNPDPEYQNKYYSFRYYCWSDKSKDSTFDEKPEFDWNSFLYPEATIDKSKAEKINYLPFFTDISKSEITEIYERNNPYGSLGQKYYYFRFKNNNYCELEILHNNGGNIDEVESYLKQNITLQVNSVSPSKSSIILNSKPSGGYPPETDLRNLQTYTNPYFPNFKLVYPSDWKFETSTSPSVYKGLVERKISLRKKLQDNSWSLDISMSPRGNVGGGRMEGTSIQKGFRSNIFANGIVNYGPTQDSTIWWIQSNIKTQEYPEARTWEGEQNISYMMFATAYFGDERDQKTIAELDQIISQSSFQ